MATRPEIVAELFELEEVPDLAPRYNIAPTQPVPVVLADDHGRRVLRMMRWGLIPAGAQDPSIGSRMINARSETVAERPAFREGFRQRRCLVVSDGFYEWRLVSPRKKIPYFIHMGDGRPFAFAGLWEHWAGPGREPIHSCTILTTEPNELLRPLHDRMPVILPQRDYVEWLARKTRPARLSELLRPYPAGEMACHPVSTRVNPPSYDAPDCTAPVEPPPTLF